MPVKIPYARVRELAAERGHVNLRVYETRGRFWRAECDCGWMSTQRALKSDAVGAAVHHFELVASGAWWRPKFPGGPTHEAALVRDPAALARRDAARTADTATAGETRRPA